MTCPRPHRYHKDTGFVHPGCLSLVQPSTDLALISGQTNSKPKGKGGRSLGLVQEPQRPVLKGWSLLSRGQRLEEGGAAQGPLLSSHQEATDVAERARALESALPVDSPQAA